MTTFDIYYLMSWAGLVLIALLMSVRSGDELALLSGSYWRFLGRRWKVVTFTFAFVGINALAPISADPTWDWVNASFMAIFAYATAPWSVGTIARGFRKQVQVPWSHLFVAVVVWLFSASWSYDLYLLLREGVYPVTWAANLVASSVLYLAAGLFWTLDWEEGEGSHFAFMRESWPAADGAAFRHVAAYAVPLLIVVGLLFLMFPFFSLTDWAP